jgi:hypothetical protein
MRRTEIRFVVLLSFVSLAGCLTPAGTYQVPDLGTAAASAIAKAADPKWAPLLPLGPLQTALIYSRFAKTPIPYEEIAYCYDDVRFAHDEFVRRDRIADSHGRIDRANQQLEGVKSLFLTVNFTLPEYDFAKGGLATGLSDTTYAMREIPQGGVKVASYAVLLANGSSFAFAPAPESAVRSAAARDTAQWRQAQIELEVQPISADERQVNAYGPVIRSVSARILRIRIVAQGSILTEVEGKPETATQPTAKEVNR